LALAALAIVGCEPQGTPSSESTSAPTTSPASKPATTQFLAPAATLPNIPATTQADAPDHLAQPTTATEYMYSQAKTGNLEAIRLMTAEPTPISDVRTIFAPMREQLRIGGKVDVVDSKVFNTVAMVICHFTSPNPADEAYFAHTFMRRYDRWRIQLADINPRRLTEGEVNSARVAIAWAKQRVIELRDQAAKRNAASSQPAATPPK
jgi:hypothetical protein